MADLTPDEILALGLGPIAVPQKTPAGPALKPGDPGWSILQSTQPAAAPVAKAPAGPRPGDPGFSLANLPPTVSSPAPTPAPAPAPAAHPSVSPEQLAQLAVANKSVEQVQADAQDAARMKREGIPMVKGLSPTTAQALANAVPPQKPSAPEGIVFPGSAAGQSLAAPIRILAHEVAVVNPARQKAYGAALDNEASAERAVGDAAVGVTNAEAEGEKNVAQELRNHSTDTQARAFDNKTESKKFLEHLNAFSKDLAEDRIDPQGMWHNASTGQKVTWTLAAMFGAVAQGLLKLPTNQAADRLVQMAREDVEAQRSNHAIKRGRLEDMNTFYGLARQVTKDDEEAAKLANGYAITAVEHEARALGAASKSPLVKAQTERLVSQLETKKVEAGIHMNKWVPEGVAGGAGAKVEPKNVFYDPVTKRYFAARNEDSRKNLVKAAELAARIKDASKKYSESLSKVGVWDKTTGKMHLDTSAMSRARGDYIALLDDIREANQEGGVIREGLMKAGIYEHSLVPPDQFTGDAAQSMAAIGERVDNLHRSVFATESPVPVVEAEQPVGSAPKSVPTGQNYSRAPAATERSVEFTPAGQEPPPKSDERAKQNAKPLTSVQRYAKKAGVSRDTTTSDDRAKLNTAKIEAYQQGLKDAAGRDKAASAEIGPSYRATPAEVNEANNNAKVAAYAEGIGEGKKRAGAEQKAAAKQDAEDVSRADHATKAIYGAALGGLLPGGPVTQGALAGYHGVLAAGHAPTVPAVVQRAGERFDQAADAVAQQAGRLYPEIPLAPAAPAAPAQPINNPTQLAPPASPLVTRAATPNVVPAEWQKPTESDERAKTAVQPARSIFEQIRNRASAAGSASTGGAGVSPGYAEKKENHIEGFAYSDEKTKNTEGHAQMAQALRSLAPYSYEYKPGFAEAEGQREGEKNVGPMAQNMAKDPIASTAIVQQPDGLLAIDKSKALKLALGGLASLQAQVDDLKHGGIAAAYANKKGR